MSRELDRVITQGAAQAQLRLDDGQFALRSFQPRVSSVRNVQALVVYSALCRRYPVSLPKIRSIWIRDAPQNHRIIKFDACDPALTQFRGCCAPLASS